MFQPDSYIKCIIYAFIDSDFIQTMNWCLQGSPIFFIGTIFRLGDAIEKIAFDNFDSSIEYLEFNVLINLMRRINLVDSRYYCIQGKGEWTDGLEKLW